MLVYDITSQSSFIDIKRWINAVEEVSKSLELLYYTCTDTRTHVFT